MDLINILFAKALNKEDATKEYVDEAIKALKGEVNADLDTLEELSKALGNDPDFFLTIKNELDEKITQEEFNSAITNLVSISNYNPIDKTDSMTQPVGKSTDGKLWTSPGSGTGSAEAVLYTSQSLTDDQQTQARTNIAAASVETVNGLKNELVADKDKVTENTRFAIGTAEQTLEVPSMEEFNAVKDDITEKIDKPTSDDNNKFPRAKDGDVEWVEQGLPTDEQTANAVQNWLTEHPEATTTVDYVITTKVFDNVAKMISDISLKAGEKCKTLGYYTINDGGGSYYYIREKKQGDDNDISVCVISETISAEMIENGYVSIKQFGISDGDDCASTFEQVIAKYNNIKFDGSFVCNSTIHISNNKMDYLYLDFRNCTITLQANCNLFDFDGEKIVFVGGMFKLKSGLTFDKAFMYFGGGNNYHRDVYLKDFTIQGNKMYSTNSYAFEDSLKSMNTRPKNIVSGCGIMIYGNNTAPSTRMLFCRFSNYKIFNVGIGVYMAIEKQDSVFSYITDIEFDGIMQYTGKAFVVLGDERGTSGYPSTIRISGSYQGASKTNKDGDEFINIVKSSGPIYFNVKHWDDNRNRFLIKNADCHFSSLGNALSPMDIAGADLIEYANNNGRFSSCSPMSLMIESGDRKGLLDDMDYIIFQNSKIFTYSHRANEEMLKVFVAYDGNRNFNIQNAKSISVSFDFCHNSNSPVRVYAYMVPTTYEHDLVSIGYTSYGNAKSIIESVDAENKKLILDSTEDIDVGMYCIEEGSKYSNVIFNPTSNPISDVYSNFPKVVSKTDNSVILDDKMLTKQYFTKQQVIFGNAGSGITTNIRLGSVSFYPSDDYTSGIITTNIEQLKHIKNVRINILFYNHNVNEDIDYKIKNIVLEIK